MQKEAIHGGDIYRNQVFVDFSININPLGIPQKVKETLQDAIVLCDRYPDLKAEKLREAISKQQGVGGENLLFGNGASELFGAIVHALKPKKAVVPVPSFFGYEHALKMEKVKVVYCAEKKLMQNLTEKVDLLFLANPNNPDGRLMQRGELLQILSECQKKGIFVVLDECFIEFCKEDCSMLPFIKKFRNLLIVRAFTKIYAIPGIRLGYAIGSDRILLKKIQKQLPEWNLSVFAQEAGVSCTGQQNYIEETKGFVAKEREFLKKELEKIGIFAIGSANFLFFQGPENLYDMLLARGILIRDCSNFRGLSRGDYRIAVKKHFENELLIQSLKEVLQIEQN